jgi:hypothetical protein
VSDTSQEHLARRLDGLERENRRLKRLGTLALVGLAALIIMGQTAPAPVANTIEAERFVLRDTAGNVRASLGLRPDGTAALGLADDTQQERALLSVTAQGLAAVELTERSGRLRAGLAVRPDGAATLALLDQADRPRVELGATGLTLYDRNGRRRSSMGLEPAGAPAVWLYDGEGNGRAMLAVTSDGQPTLNLADAGGKGRLWLRVSSDFQLPFLSLHDRDGKQRVSILLRQGGVPQLALGDANERVIWKAPSP